MCYASLAPTLQVYCARRAGLAEPGIPRRNAARERHKHHMSCFDTRVTNEPYLASSIKHDDHRLITKGICEHTVRSQIRQAGSLWDRVQALREQLVEEKELALDRGDQEPSVRATRLCISIVSQL